MKAFWVTREIRNKWSCSASVSIILTDLGTRKEHRCFKKGLDSVPALTCSSCKSLSMLNLLRFLVSGCLTVAALPIFLLIPRPSKSYPSMHDTPGGVSRALLKTPPGQAHSWLNASGSKRHTVTQDQVVVNWSLCPWETPTVRPQLTHSGKAGACAIHSCFTSSKCGLCSATTHFWREEGRDAGMVCSEQKWQAGQLRMKHTEPRTWIRCLDAENRVRPAAQHHHSKLRWSCGLSPDKPLNGLRVPQFYYLT